MIHPSYSSQNFIDPQQLQDMVGKAMEARDQAYCPYSEYKVGAAILTESGQIFSGCNVENASYSVTICAERTAITKAVSEGNRKIKAVVVIADGSAAPCGACRQAISEFSLDAPVIGVNPNGEIYNTWTVQQLLPDGFNVKNLSD